MYHGSKHAINRGNEEEDNYMSEQYKKLLNLLKELFQSNQADLDFGIYRVINQRRVEINCFLNEELLHQVKDSFAEYQSVESDVLKIELQKAIKQARDLGVNAEEVSKVKEIRGQLVAFNVDINDLENHVYSALYNFFRRYYDDGDFITQRRYKEGVYAIPYEGEEVKLHWANHEQYYIKRSEYFRDYSFKLLSGKLVHFKLVEADTRKDDRKEPDDKKRRFILAEEPPAWQNGEVVIRFEFRLDDENRNQQQCNRATLNVILGLRKSLAEQALKDAIAELAVLVPTESNKDRTLLERHLEDYTRRNTQDYFIHKNLSKFLRRELDFFIKNEIMHLDNIDHESAPRVEQYLSKIKVIRRIAHQIIDFLAQVENFQKKLWLKKKFVVETDYCITLNNVPEELYPEIAANDAQREEWVKLFAIDEINGDMFAVDYSNPLTVDFLKANPFLLIDTGFFETDFRYRLLERINDLDEKLDGVLIHGENYQALNLIENRYRELVDYIYIDPPYNRPGTDSEILYKNNFPNSTWLSMIFDRLYRARTLLKPKSPMTIAIDDYELANLSKLMEVVFPNSDIQKVVVNHYPGSGSGRGNISRTHEYALFAIPSGQDILRGKLKESGERKRGFKRSGTGENNYREGRPNSFFAILVDPDSFQIMGLEPPPDKTEKDYPREKTSKGYVRVYPIGKDDSERVWSLSYEGTVLALQEERLFCTKNLVIKRTYVEDDDSREILTSVWLNTKFNASVHGTTLLTNMLGESGLFSYPKSVHTVSTSIDASVPNKPNALIIDFFAGSGTTGHAVINLNRGDENSRRKYILVEMASYFKKVLKPRIQKAIYSEDWSNGKPVSRKGISHVFKYIKLESYEDTLNNLELIRKEEQVQALLSDKAFRNDYLLHYMLDVESTGSLLDIRKFDAPFDYQLEIASSMAGETTPTKIDLVETFNYLLGLHVKTNRKIEGCVVVAGHTRDNRQILILWRHVPSMDNAKLDEFFKRHIIGELDEVTDIYVNGDNNLANLRQKNQHWKVHLTEKSFHQLMFTDSDEL